MDHVTLAFLPVFFSDYIGAILAIIHLIRIELFLSVAYPLMLDGEYYVLMRIIL